MELLQQVEALQLDIRRLRLEHDILKKANERLKKDLGVGSHLLSNRDKVMLVKALKDTYSLIELLTELGFARSSYFYHRAKLFGSDKYADVRLAMTDIFEGNYRCYGYRRMRSALNRQQLCVSEKVVRRLMKQQCLVVAANKRRRYGEVAPIV